MGWRSLRLDLRLAHFVLESAYHYELPKIGAWLNVVNSRDTTCAALSEAAF